MSRSEFLNIVAPITVKVRVDGGVLLPSVSLAQMLLETGGKIHSWLNLVGYKVGSGRLTDYWHGRSVSTKTWEVYNGVRQDNVTANWRAYDSIEDCLKDQALLFLNNRSRYQPVIDAKTPEDQANALRRSGYATDPQYSAKIMSIIQSGGFEQYDKEAELGMEAIKELRKEISDLKALLQETDPPEWAKGTVEKLTKNKLLDDPKGTRSFHRTLVVLDRAGIFER